MQTLTASVWNEHVHFSEILHYFSRECKNWQWLVANTCQSQQEGWALWRVNGMKKMNNKTSYFTSVNDKKFCFWVNYTFKIHIHKNLCCNPFTLRQKAKESPENGKMSSVIHSVCGGHLRMRRKEECKQSNGSKTSWTHTHTLEVSFIQTKYTKWECHRSLRSTIARHKHKKKC